MKKKGDQIILGESKDKNVLNESCFMMNIPKTLNTVEGNHLLNLSEETKIPLQNSLTPPQSIASSPSPIKIKLERENSPLGTQDGNFDAINDKFSPPLSSLGPGAEIKGKLCNPIPSSSKVEEVDNLDEVCRSVPVGSSGGRLTFFKEGKLLLELSHRSEQGSWVQVKSKTYWPPPSTTTTTTTIQHPLRHDTPTPHSDDCSSLNSSPWLSDHFRKQVGPSHRNKLWHSNDHLFYIKRSPFIKRLRRKVRLRRNSLLKILGPVYTCIDFNMGNDFNSIVKDMKINERKKRLEKVIARLRQKYCLSTDETASVRALFEKTDGVSSDSTDPTFATPRKRYLRTMESDHESHTRKKAHSGSNSTMPQVKPCDRHSATISPSVHPSPKSAITSHNSSAYSIDSLLSSSESECKKSDSYLRTLLKPDKGQRSLQPRHGPVRERNADTINSLKVERGGSPYPKERKETVLDPKKVLPDRYDLNQDLSRFTSHSSLGSLYLNPYFDPRYMMLHSLSAAPPFLPAVSQSSDVASAVAAAAAVAGYPLSPLHLSALAGNTLLPGRVLPPASYPPVTSITSSLIRSPTPNRSSPLSVPHSPSPKLSPAPPPVPLSPHLRGSPCDPWGVTSAFQNSPHKYPSTSSVSPPPQDVPLNLTKHKRK